MKSVITLVSDPDINIKGNPYITRQNSVSGVILHDDYLLTSTIPSLKGWYFSLETTDSVPYFLKYIWLFL